MSLPALVTQAGPVQAASAVALSASLVGLFLAAALVKVEQGRTGVGRGDCGGRGRICCTRLSQGRQQDESAREEYEQSGAVFPPELGGYPEQQAHVSSVVPYPGGYCVFPCPCSHANGFAWMSVSVISLVCC